MGKRARRMPSLLSDCRCQLVPRQTLTIKVSQEINPSRLLLLSKMSIVPSRFKGKTQRQFRETKVIVRKAMSCRQSVLNVTSSLTYPFAMFNSRPRLWSSSDWAIPGRRSDIRQTRIIKLLLMLKMWAAAYSQSIAKVGPVSAIRCQTLLL